MSSDRHGRDPGVSELVRYFDQPEKCSWQFLSNKEANVLYEEIRKCSDPETGFPYIGRNYYRITTKSGSDIYLKFKEPQELVWETIKYLRWRGRGVKLLVIKARQLYTSTIASAYLYYCTQFTPNNRGLLVSYSEGHAAELFDLVLHIHDQLPWWLRPMIGSRKYQEGIHLINPDESLRYLEPGLNSKILVQGANQSVGVAEGQTVNTAHLSEFGSWDPIKARKIIVSDFRWALPDDPGTTAILESRVRQASKFAEELWEGSVELGDQADWYPLFMPIYFDKSHFIAPRKGWKPEEPELAVKTRAAEEWCVCDGCGQFRPARFGGASMDGLSCLDCKKGFYRPYVMQDGQMLWLQERRKNAEKHGDEALTEMQQSLATNPQEAFASVTESIFSKQARDWVSSTVSTHELARGYMASDGQFHAPRRVLRSEGEMKPGEPRYKEIAICFAPGCKADHTGETERYLKIWQPPQRGFRYAISGDVAAGLGGRSDYSVAIVNKISPAPSPDIQVATYRCNTISAWHFAEVVAAIGKWYNNALAIVDYTNYQTTGDRLLNELRYPNIYQWFFADAIKQNSNRWHWVWNGKNKEDGWTTLDGWLRDHSYIIKDPIIAKEIRHFHRLQDGTLGCSDARDKEEAGNIHDDTVTAVCQCIIASHQRDPRRPGQIIASQPDGVRGAGTWLGSCRKCEKDFPAQAPCERDKCPFCGSFWLSWRMPNAEGAVGVGRNAILGFEWEQMAEIPGKGRDAAGPSSSFSFGDCSSGDMF